MKNILTLVLFVFLVTSCNSENKFDITNVDVNLSNKIERVEPPNWWIDMKTKDIQLLIYGKKISNYVPDDRLLSAEVGVCLPSTLST